MKRSDVYLLTLYSVYLMATMGPQPHGRVRGPDVAWPGGVLRHRRLSRGDSPEVRLAFFVVLPGAAITCFVVGLALGFPALRVQHHYLAFATLGFNVLVFLVMRNEEKITGGTFGISGIPRPSLFGFDLSGHLAYFYFTLASLVVLGLLLWWLLRSPWGRAVRSLARQSDPGREPRRQHHGLHALRLRIGAACAGVGGVYFASLVEFIEPGPFHFSTSLTMLLAVIVGGSGRFFGPVVGTRSSCSCPRRCVRRAHRGSSSCRRGTSSCSHRGGGAHDLSARRPPVDSRALQGQGARNMTSKPSFLEVKDVAKHYGAIRAVDGVSLRVAPGEIVGVIGPNGSGKTTLFNSILGQIKPTAGSVEFCGEDITGMSPLELSRRGVGRTFQTLQVFGKMSVRDNLIVAAQEFKGTLRGRLFAAPDAGLGHHADEMIELFRLKHVAHLLAGTLSYGQQKLIDIAMAFMPAPRLVLLDEPCAGVNPSLVEQLRELLVELNKTLGGSFVVIEHNMDFIMKLCPHVICMVEARCWRRAPRATCRRTGRCSKPTSGTDGR